MRTFVDLNNHRSTAMLYGEDDMEKFFPILRKWGDEVLAPDISQQLSFPELTEPAYQWDFWKYMQTCPVETKFLLAALKTSSVTR